MTAPAIAKLAAEMREAAEAATEYGWDANYDAPPPENLVTLLDALAALQADNERIAGELVDYEKRARASALAHARLTEELERARRKIDDMDTLVRLEEMRRGDLAVIRAAAAETARDAALEHVARLRESLKDIFDERRRQVEVEGWTLEHDDRHVQGELARAAAYYALRFSADGMPKTWTEDHPTERELVFGLGYRPKKIWHFSDKNTVQHAADLAWPFDPVERKPADPRRMLVKAGALILAEIERLDRARVLAETAPADGVGDGR